MEMARLEYIIISSWNMEIRIKAVDALASYNKKALPSLTSVASSLLWNADLESFCIQVNEKDVGRKQIQVDSFFEILFLSLR
jgi:hypothetical protein